MNALERAILDQQRYEERLSDLVGGAGLRAALGDNFLDTIRWRESLDATLAATGLGATHLVSSNRVSETPARTSALPPPSPDLQNKLREVEQQKAQLRSEIDQKTRELAVQKANSQQKDDAIRSLQEKYEQLVEQQALTHLLARVEPQAQQRLLESPEFRNEFVSEQLREAFVLSVDIRRSTELMLKSREPRLFAQFITELTHSLRDIILLNHGIFDKFTGDGILAFFPLFYSGPDAGFCALQAAQQAHGAFASLYAERRECFSTVLLDVGLGVGIDFGPVQMVQFASEFTVVGQPVVYASRMAGAPAGDTFLNQPAYEQIRTKYSVVCDVNPVEHNVKNEGRTLAYVVRLNGRPYTPEQPRWQPA